MDTSTETWLPVAGFEGHYEVSDAGRVRSFKREKPRLLTPYANQNMTLMVSLWMNGVRTCCSIQRLVAQAFLPAPRPGMEAYHLSKDLHDNRPSNLVWKQVQR